MHLYIWFLKLTDSSADRKSEYPKSEYNIFTWKSEKIKAGLEQIAQLRLSCVHQSQQQTLAGSAGAEQSLDWAHQQASACSYS